MSGLLVQADARSIPLRDRSVQTVVTSPPYWGLRRYEGVSDSAWGGDPGHAHEWGSQERGRRSDLLPSEASSSEARKGVDARQDGATQDGGRFCACGAWLGCLGLEPTPDLFIDHLVGIFRDVRRVLRDDGTLWVNMGDSFARTSAKGIKFQGGHNALCRNQQAEEGIRGPDIPDGLKEKDLIGVPWMLAFALRADGWYLRSDIVWAKGVSFCPTYAGSCMPESIRDRPTRAHEFLFLLSKSPTYFYDGEAVKEVGRYGDHPRTVRGLIKATNTPGQKAHNGLRAGYANKDNFQRNGSKRGEPLVPGARVGTHRQGREPTHYTGKRNLRSVWAISPRGYDGAHFAVFPENLVEPCVKAGTSAKGACHECGAPWRRVTKTTGRDRDDAGRTKHDAADRMGNAPPPERGWETETLWWEPSCAHGGPPVPCVVLDPFAGSGTTVRVARRLGRAGVGLDISRKYLDECARARAGAGIQMEIVE